MEKTKLLINDLVPDTVSIINVFSNAHKLFIQRSIEWTIVCNMVASVSINFGFDLLIVDYQYAYVKLNCLNSSVEPQDERTTIK